MNTIFDRPIVAEKLATTLPPCRKPASTNKIARTFLASQRSSVCKPVCAVRADQTAEKADTNTLQLIADITR